MTQRRRAPHRPGHRTTLTVPPEVYARAEQLAGKLGTTTNDALLRLAGEGAAARERRERIAALAEARGAAIDGVGVVDTSVFPSPEEPRDALMSGRSDD